ncbi:MAG: porin family protein [Rhizobiales bacterium]|nr:porin family protein [Hyphomicrobiales bacterium]
MKTGLIAAIVTFGFVTATYAGDSIGRNGAPSAGWSGVYVGINGGYGWSANEGAIYAFFPSEPTPLRPIAATLNTKGGFGGVQLGYNRQVRDFVLGIEADIQGANISSYGAGPTPFIFLNENVTGNLKVDAFGTVRGRLGYVFNNILIYATGGAAAGRANFALSYSNATEFGALSQQSLLTGWVIGGGLEQMISANWSLKAEYQRINLGDIRVAGTVPVTCSVTPCPLTSSQNINFNNARIGLNYRFGAY